MGIEIFKKELLILVVFLIFLNINGENQQMKVELKKQSAHTYFYYSNYDKINSMFFLDSNKKITPLELGIRKKIKLYNAFSKKTLKYDLKSYVCQIGRKRTIFFAKARQKQVVKNFEIFSSDKQVAINKPTKQSRLVFKNYFNKCLRQRESEQCIYPKLLYTSDLNNNGHLEYWFIQPYMYELGFSIFEIHNNKVKFLVESCPCCD